MTDDGFARAIVRGLGRAAQHVREHSLTAPQMAALIHTALHNPVYDMQCEGDRSGWVMQLVAEAGLRNGLREQLIPRLRRTPLNEPSQRVHLCRLCGDYAARGDEAMLAELYATVAGNPFDTEFVGEPELMWADGLAAFLFCVSHRGRRLRETGSDYPDDEVLETAAEILDSSEGDLVGHLRSAARNGNSDIGAWLDARDGRGEYQLSGLGIRGVRKGDVALAADMRRPQAPQWTDAAELLAALEPGSQALRSRCLQFGRKHATPDDVAQLVATAEVEADHDRLVCILFALAEVVLPTAPPRLVTLMDAGDPMMATSAGRALRGCKAPELRAIALARLEAGRLDECTLCLLQGSFVHDDLVLLEAAMSGPRLRSMDRGDRSALHSWFYELNDLAGMRPSAAWQALLITCCEWTPCSNCRQRAVQLLIESAALPAWLAEECKDDGRDWVRDTVRQGRG
ncbi:MAG: hypothetical protein AB7K09_05295 [Planctomycetota bacterium]